MKRLLGIMACLAMTNAFGMQQLPEAKKVYSVTRDSQDGLIARALAIYDRTTYYLLPIITDTEYDLIYANDRAYLSQFPFSSYDINNIPSQGAFFDDRIDDTIKNTLRKGKPWESHIQDLIQKYSRRGSVVLDIGAHIGTHTVTMSKSVGPNGAVFAFEPNKKIHRELCLNLALNRCQNVTPIRSAMGKEHDIIEIVTSHPRNEGGSYAVSAKGGDNLASMIRLDDLQLNNVSFLKLDVENMEADVLRGARNTIKRNRPIMLIEIQGNGERPVQLQEDTKKMHQESVDLIKSMGYRLVYISGCDYLAFPE